MLASLRASSSQKWGFSQTNSFKNKAGRGRPIQASVSPLNFQSLSPLLSQGMVSVTSVI